MTLLESVTRSIRNWPTLYGCRTDVLHQYFCVIGTGMEWQDGALVDPYGDPTEAERAIMLADEEEEIASLIPALSVDGPLSEDMRLRVIALTRATARWRSTKVMFRRDNADFLAYVEWSRFADGGLDVPPQTIYPLSSHSAMAQVPDDVQPDWLAGVREMIFAVFRAPAHGTAMTVNINFAANVLANLHERFGSPEGIPTSYAAWARSGS